MEIVSDSGDEMPTKKGNKSFAIRRPDDIFIKEEVCGVICRYCKNPESLTIGNWWNYTILKWAINLSWLSELTLENDEHLLQRRAPKVETVDATKDIVRLNHSVVKDLLCSFKKLTKLSLRNVECIPDLECGCEKNAETREDRQLDWYRPMGSVKVTVKVASSSNLDVKVRGTLPDFKVIEGVINTENIMFAFPICCIDNTAINCVELNNVATRLKTIKVILCTPLSLKSARFVDVLVEPTDDTVAEKKLITNIESLHVEYTSNVTHAFSVPKNLMSMRTFSGISYTNLTRQTFIGVSDAEPTTKHYEFCQLLSRPTNTELSYCHFNGDLIQNLVESFKCGSRMVLKDVRIPNAKQALQKLNTTKICKFSSTDVQDDLVTATIDIVSVLESANTGEKTKKKVNLTSCKYEDFDVPYTALSRYEYVCNNLSHHYAKAFKFLQQCQIGKSIRCVDEVFFQDIRLILIAKNHETPMKVFPELVETLDLRRGSESSLSYLSTIVLFAQEEDLQLANETIEQEKYGAFFQNVLLFLVRESTTLSNIKNLLKSFPTQNGVITITTTHQRCLDDLDNALVDMTFRSVEPLSMNLNNLLKTTEDSSYNMSDNIVIKAYISDENATLERGNENKTHIKETLLAILELYKELGIAVPKSLENHRKSNQTRMQQFKKTVIKKFGQHGIGCASRLDTVYIYLDDSLPDKRTVEIKATLATLASNIPYTVIAVKQVCPLAYVGACVGKTICGTLGGFAEDDNQKDNLFALLSRHVSVQELRARGNDALFYGNTNIGRILAPLTGPRDIAMAMINTQYIPSCHKAIRDDHQEERGCHVADIAEGDERFLNKLVFINGAQTAPGYGILVHVDLSFGNEGHFMLTIENHQAKQGKKANDPNEKVTDFCTNGDSGALVLYRDFNRNMFALGIIQGERFFNPGEAEGQRKQFLAERLNEGLQYLSTNHGGTYRLSQ